MDFSPLGATHFFGTDQITSDIINNYDAMITDAKIRQRKNEVYMDELDRLQRAQASKLNKPVNPSESFATKQLKKELPYESFGGRPHRCGGNLSMFGRSNNELVMYFVLIIIAIIVITVIKSVFKACSEITRIKNLFVILSEEKNNKNKTGIQQPILGLNQGATSPDGFMVTARQQTPSTQQQTPPASPS